jgi:hypothetical protein
LEKQRVLWKNRGAKEWEVRINKNTRINKNKKLQDENLSL